MTNVRETLEKETKKSYCGTKRNTGREKDSESYINNIVSFRFLFRFLINNVCFHLAGAQVRDIG